MVNKNYQPVIKPIEITVVLKETKRKTKIKKLDTIMKLKTLYVAIALVVAGMTATAQTTATADANQTSSKADKMYRPLEFTDFAFEGILMTPDQQQKIDAINAEMKAKRGSCDVKPDCKKGECKKGECPKSECKKGECKKDRSKMRRGECMKEYASKVKEVLTPEQYVVFLENIVFTDNGPKGMGGKPSGDRPCKKADCPKAK